MMAGLILLRKSLPMFLCVCYWTSLAETNMDQLVRRQKAFEAWVMQDVAYVNEMLAKIEKEVKRMNTTIQQLPLQNMLLTTKRDDNALDSHLSSASTRLTRAFSDHKLAVAERISALSSNFSDLQDTFQSLSKEITNEKSKEEMHNTLSERLTEVFKITEEIRKDLSEIQDDVESKVTELNEVCKVTKTDISTLKTGIVEAMIARQDRLETQLIDSVKESSTRMSSVLITLKTIQDAQKEWSNKLEEKVFGLREELRNEISKIKSEYQSRLADHNSIKRTGAEIVGQLAALDTRIGNIESRFAEEVTSLTSQLNQVKQNARSGGPNIHQFLRLAGPSNDRGRVEILYKGQWGTVCDTLFNKHAATVVCKMLGFTSGEETDEFGAGTGPIWLDQVRCKGYEKNILDCRRLDIGEHRCHSRRKDVGVVCR